MAMSRVYIASYVLLVLGLPQGTRALEIAPSEDNVKGIVLDSIPVSLRLRHQDLEYDLDLLGSGVRKQLMFKVYECAAYAEVGADLEKPFRALTGGHFVKHLRLVFLRDTTGPKVRTSVDTGFRQAHGTNHKFTVELETLLSRLDEGMLAGEVLQLTWIPEAGLFTRVNDRAYPPIPGDSFARAVFTVWFGGRPISNRLKHDMVRLVRAQ